MHPARCHSFVVADVIKRAVLGHRNRRTAVGEYQHRPNSRQGDSFEELWLCLRETPFRIQTHPMSASGLVDICQLALGIDLSNPAPGMGKINISLRINDNAGARV